MSNRNNIRDSLNKKLATLSGVNYPALDIEKIVALSKDSFKLTFTSNNRNYGESEFAEAIENYFNNTFSLVESTLQSLSNIRHSAMYSCIVAANNISKDYCDEALSSMKVVTANVFKDKEDDSIWNVVSVGNEKRLVQQSKDNLVEILEQRKSRQKTVASIEEVNSFKNGEYVYFYNPVSYKTESGYGLHIKDKQCIISKTSGNIFSVNPNAIIATVDLPIEGIDPIKNKEEATLSTEDVNTLVEYYRKLYGDKPEFFKELERQIRDTVIQKPMERTTVESKAISKPEYHTAAKLTIEEVMGHPLYKRLDEGLKKIFKMSGQTFDGVSPDSKFLNFYFSEGVKINSKSIEALNKLLTKLGLSTYDFSGPGNNLLHIDIKPKMFKK